MVAALARAATPDQREAREAGGAAEGVEATAGIRAGGGRCAVDGARAGGGVSLRARKEAIWVLQRPIWGRWQPGGWFYLNSKF